MRIDVMNPEDWPFVSNIYNQAIEKGGASVLSQCPTYPEWDAKHHADLRFVMREEDQVIGWCALSPYSERYAYRGVAEVSVYVDDAYQGKGIGKTLLNHTIVRSEEKGIWTLFSKTFSSNIVSIKLQESCGFRVVGIHEKLGHDRWGKFQDITILERRSKIIQIEQ